MSEESKCECRHCGGHIAFPSEAAGYSVECPHCANQTLLFLPPADSQFVSCACQHCKRGFEFDASKLVEENSLVPCPFCGQETKLFVPSPDDNPNSDQRAQEDKARERSAELSAMADALMDKNDPEWKLIEEAANSMTIISKQDALTIRGEIITIRKRGWANALASGMNGDRAIQVSSLTAVQMGYSRFFMANASKI